MAVCIAASRAPVRLDTLPGARVKDDNGLNLLTGVDVMLSPRLIFLRFGRAESGPGGVSWPACSDVEREE